MLGLAWGGWYTYQSPHNSPPLTTSHTLCHHPRTLNLVNSAGMSSYVLFTLDKLVQKVVKQMQLVLQEEQTHRLVELWKYEDSRGAVVSKLALVLRWRCVTLLSWRH